MIVRITYLNTQKNIYKTLFENFDYTNEEDEEKPYKNDL